MLDYSLLQRVGLHPQLFNNDISAQQVAIEEGEVIFKSGDPCESFVLVVSGTIRVEITTKSGRELVLYRIGECDTCIITTSILLNGGEYYARAITESAILAITIPAADFHKALSLSLEFTNYILASYAKRMTALMTLLDKIASKDISHELFSWLLSSANTSNTIWTTQSTIAKEIGTSREVVSRKLAMLSNQGIIKVSRGSITILHADLLKELLSL